MRRNVSARYKDVLNMFKMDLGISHEKRDSYFHALLNSSEKELEEKGIVLELQKIEDIMLLSDYAAWNYRKRTENVGMSRNLKNRIANRKMKRRCKEDG